MRRVASRTEATARMRTATAASTAPSAASASRMRAIPARAARQATTCSRLRGASSIPRRHVPPTTTLPRDVRAAMMGDAFSELMQDSGGEEIVIGARVRISSDVIVFHLPKAYPDGINIKGKEGVVVDRADRYEDRETTANMPFKVECLRDDGKKFFVHLVSVVDTPLALRSRALRFRPRPQPCMPRS